MTQVEQLGSYTYRPAGFPLGRDTLHLSAFATVRRRDRVCDLGCGGGPLLLLLAGRADGLRLTGVELSPEAAEAARKNLSENGIPGDVLSGDLREIRALLPAGAFDLVVSNPPWFPTGTGSSGGESRMEECCTLDDVCAAAGYLLKNGGRFALVHRPERLADVLEALRRYTMEPKRLQLVQHSGKHSPSAVLVEAVRQGRPGLTLLPTLIPAIGGRYKNT